MAPAGRYPSSTSKGRKKNRDRMIYGGFGNSDSDDIDDMDMPNGEMTLGYYSNHYGDSSDDEGRPSGTSTQFVKGGTLNPDKTTENTYKNDVKVSLWTTRKQHNSEEAEYISEVEIDEDMDNIDIIDRILDDDQHQYSKQSIHSSDIYDDLDMNVVISSKKIKMGDEPQQNRRQNMKRSNSGLAYNPDVGLQPKQMDKMYGKGLKMLQKMGYTGGGLGRDGTGVVVPIEVKMRAKQRGLQNEGEVSDNNRHLITRMQKKQVHITGIDASYSNLWRKRSSSIRMYPNVQSDPAPELDMLINDLSEKLKCHAEMERSNRNQLDIAEQSLNAAEDTIKHLEDGISHKEKLIESMVSYIPCVIDICVDFDRRLTVTHPTDENFYCDLLLQFLNSLSEHNGQKSEEVSALRVMEIVCNYTEVCLSNLFNEWDVEEEPNRGSELIHRICESFLVDEMEERVCSFLKFSVHPKVVDYFSNKWSVTDTDKGLRCFEVWNTIPSVKSNINSCLSTEIKNALVKRLINYVSNSGDIHVAHIVVHPWLSIFDNDNIYDLLRVFIQSAKEMLSKECIGDVKRCQKTLEAWKVLMKREDEDMINSHLYSCLTLVLKDVNINPRNQDTIVIEKVLQWHDYIGNERMSDVFCKDFMTRWLKVLRSWLALPSANFEEVIIWYTGWKSLFPSAMLKRTALEQSFKDALMCMDRVSRDVLNSPTSDDHRENVVNNEMTAETVRRHVENVGATHGLTLIKRSGMKHDGKQVYMFGYATIVFDGDRVMFLKGREATPISVEELIKVAL
ncbi:tuftelin-interacting 11-like, putative [Babesia ovis]|uniref:Tuftelin-interacting 11-like, putative n=1 Tax=Babesia ovis TaxID=5869 RepID=A0A9W5TA24_BABOV|nr:tuftelin-interacting 11-like, putative [Babesia ovis]